MLYLAVKGGHGIWHPTGAGCLKKCAWYLAATRVHGMAPNRSRMFLCVWYLAATGGVHNMVNQQSA
jgi:hypothetical protein